MKVDSGVSPATGVIIMVAITVTLSISMGVYMTSFQPSETPQSPPAITKQPNPDGSITLRVVSNPSNTTIIVQTSDSKTTLRKVGEETTISAYETAAVIYKKYGKELYLFTASGGNAGELVPLGLIKPTDSTNTTSFTLIEDPDYTQIDRDTGTYYVSEGCCNSASISGYNISDVKNPDQLPVSYSAPGIGYVEDITVIDNYLFAPSAYDNNPVSVFNISDPDNPSFVGNTTREYYLHDVDATSDRDTLVVSGDTNLFLYNYSNVTNNYKVDYTSSLSVGSRRVEVVQDTAYLLNGSYITSVDVSDPNNPTILSATNTPSNANYGFDVGENGYAYVINGTAVRIYDISDPNDINKVGELKNLPETYAGEGTYGNNRIYYPSYDTNQLIIIDTTDKSNPTIEARHNISNSAHATTLGRGFVIVDNHIFTG